MTVSTFIVDDHNDALPKIYRQIGRKACPSENLTMIHFDAHPDLTIPDISPIDVCNPKLLYDKISIESWIVPALSYGKMSIHRLSRKFSKRRH